MTCLLVKNGTGNASVRFRLGPAVAGASLDLPLPFCHVDEPSVYAEYSAKVSGKVTKGLTPPDAPIGIYTTWSQGCTLLDGQGYW